MDQIKLHKKIDVLLLKNPNVVKREEVSALISVNEDARSYFFTEADERWLDWLWENGFLDIIKQKAEDPTRRGYSRMPEINYLARVSEKEPARARVVDIMLEVPVSEENFNPEVVNRFLDICSGLPAQELKRMVKKIGDERWVPLMKAFDDWGFEYEKMLKILTVANDFDSVLILAEAILSVRTEHEPKQTLQRFSSDNPFYFHELSYTKVFEYLLKIDKKSSEKALALVTDTMKRVIFFKEKGGKDEVFKVYDSFLLSDVDFFTLELTERNRFSHEEDIKNLAAVIKYYAVQIIEKQCGNADLVTKFYNKYFEPLPDSRSMWRLRLFVLSLCPEAFKGEFKKAFFRLFDVDRYYNELISGTEYLKALRIGFPDLSEPDKREYVKSVIEYFIKKDREKKSVKEDWHIGYGSHILSVITQLTEEEKQKAKDAGFTLYPDYEPRPSIGMTEFGSIRPRGPITQEEFRKLSISDITQKLQTDWTPEKLSSQNTSRDFQTPLNAEGVGELLRKDIPQRLQDYITNAPLFFKRGLIDQHYTYSFLRGIQEFLRGNKADVRNINWDSLIALCISIKESGETAPFDNEKRERDSFDAWLSDWTEVHSATTDVIRELLSEEGGNVTIDFPKYRNNLLAMTSYLLAYPDPEPKDEKIESAGMKTLSGSNEYIVSDPYSIAINTVRGRAFQALALFMYQDGKKFPKDEKIKISSDVKKLYENVLSKENTRALMFMFGHYLPSLYFRDKEWIEELLPQIFSTEPEKKNLYTAAWEGYLSTNLYEEIFFNPKIQKLYERGLTLTDADFPKQKHFKEPDEGVAVHLALAFVHYSEFGFDQNLFKIFWNMPNSDYHKEFISFIGRHSILRESAAEWIKENKVDVEKLKKFWDWALKKCQKKEALMAFGFWMRTKSSILEPKWLADHIESTLNKTGGDIEFEHEIMESLPVLAKAAPEKTLNILRIHLLQGTILKRGPGWVRVDNDFIDLFKTLYANPSTRKGTYKLIKDLLPIGNGRFWTLKEVLDAK